MRINGVYVGLGEGDISPELVKIKALLKKKFTPARNTLDDGDLFTPELTTEVRRVQDVYTSEGKPGAPFYIPGVINLELKYDVGLLPRPPVPKPVIFTVEGHMSNLWLGPTASVASTLEQQGVCKWQPVGYDCTALPFNNKDGVAELVRLVGDQSILPAGISWGIVGFSQGSMIVSEFMEQHVLPVNGSLHWRLASFRRGLAFGNPRREKDAVCAWAQSPPKVGTEGIMGAGELFVTTGTAIEGMWAEHPNKGDMFAENGEDKEGLDKTAVARIITENSWAGGQAGILARVLKLLGDIPGESLPALMAAISALMFLASNPNPHYSTVAEAGDVEWMRGVAA
jgi:hypothetical protein